MPRNNQYLPQSCVPGIIVVYRRPVLLPPLGLEILKKRSARGEINRQEFEDMKRD